MEEKKDVSEEKGVILEEDVNLEDLAEEPSEAVTEATDSLETPEVDSSPETKEFEGVDSMDKIPKGKEKDYGI